MWRTTVPIEDRTLSQFEKHFHFRIQEDLRGFILDHNGGFTTPCVFPTNVKSRKFIQMLDFSPSNPDGAWAVNERVRERIGEKRIVIGLDQKKNFVCVERNYKQQQIVVWSHVSGDFEPCLLDIPAFLRALN